MKSLTSFLPAPYRVGCIDDHQLVSIAIGSMLAPLDGIRFVGSAGSINGLLATVEEFLKRIWVKYALVGRHSTTKVDLYQRAIDDGYLPLPGQ